MESLTYLTLEEREYFLNYLTNKKHQEFINNSIKKNILFNEVLKKVKEKFNDYLDFHHDKEDGKITITIKEFDYFFEYCSINNLLIKDDEEFKNLFSLYNIFKKDLLKKKGIYINV
jgi:hypothetical protein